MKNTAKILVFIVALALVFGAIGVSTFAADESNETTTVYFQNNWLWTDVRCYFWGSSTSTNPAWAGNEMTLVGNDGTYDIYSYELPADVTGVIFNGLKNDGSGDRDQTPDITSGWYDGICYYMVWNGTTESNEFGYFTLPSGNNAVGYITANYNNTGLSGIYGEVSDFTGAESFVVEFYCGETKVGSSALVDENKVLLNGSSKSISWHILVDAESDKDEWWDTKWVNGALTIDTIPDKVVLRVDGVKVSENDVVLNSSDASYPVCVAITDNDGNITKFVSAEGYLNVKDTPKYADALESAFAGGGNVTMLRDVTLDEMVTVPSGVTATLDLNGKAITVAESTGNHIYALNNKGNLTIKDSVGGGSITARGIYNGYDGSNTSNTVEGAKMTIESGIFNAMDSNGGASVFNCAELIINGGTFNGKAAAVNSRAKGNCTINGGTFRSANGQVNYAIQNNGGVMTINNATVDEGFGAVGIWGGTTTIVDGTFLPTGLAGNTCHVVYVGSGTVYIQGGTFKMNYPAGADPDSGSAVASYSNATVEITGGTFTSHFDNISPVELSAGAEITGGTYLTHSGSLNEHPYVTNYLAPGLELDDDGSVVVEEGKVAVAGDESYATLQEAINAAEVGGTVSLLTDITADEVIQIGKSITLEGNGYSITSSASRVILITAGNVEVTIKDLDVVSNAVRVGTSDIRGISLDIQNGIKLTLDNCTVDFTDASASDWSYGINQSGETSSGNTITVNGGSYEGANVINIWGTNHTLNVDGATITSLYESSEYFIGVCVKVNEGSTANVTVANSTFAGDHAVVYEDIDNDSPATLTNNVDNTKIYAVRNGSTYYQSLQDAIDEAGDGDTLTLFNPIVLDDVVTIDKAITIDLDGHSLTGADGAIVLKVNAAATIKNGTITGNKSGTSSGLIEIYADLDLNKVTIVTSKINALRFKEGDCNATLVDCNVTGALKGYGSSVWNIQSGTYKASSDSISDQLNGSASVSGGEFHYAINVEDCAPGYVVVDNGNGTYTVKYDPVCFVDTNNNGTLDDGETIYGSLEAVFEKYQEGDVYVVITKDTSISNQVDTDADAKYYLNTNIAEGVTVEFAFATDWNYVQKMYVGENVTIKTTYLLAWTDFEVHGTINASYLYIFGGNVTIAEGAEVNVSTGDATVQVKGGATLTVNGTVNTHTINVWAGESKLVVSGDSAKVDAEWIDIWDGTPVVTVENGATLAVDSIKSSRGGSIEVDGATLDAGSIELGHNGESAGKLTATNNATVKGDVKLTSLDSEITGVEGLTVTTNIPDYKVIFEEGEYKIVPKEYIVQTNSAKFESLQEAIDAAEVGDTITLLTDIELTAGLVVDGKTLTLDLAGHTLTYGAATYSLRSASVMLSVIGNSKVTIDGDGSMLANGNQLLSVEEGSTVIIKSGIFSSNVSAYCASGVSSVASTDGKFYVINSAGYPYIGENGTWFIEGVDTGIKAEGTDGLTPYIGENGNWWIGETDTGVCATGTKGTDVTVEVVDGIIYVIYTYADGTTDKKEVGTVAGITGADGVGVKSIEKTGANGNVDTYTITLSDGTTHTFTVTNGIDGEDGNKGETGDKGDQGDKGPTGETGDKGADNDGTVTTVIIISAVCILIAVGVILVLNKKRLSWWS